MTPAKPAARIQQTLLNQVGALRGRGSALARGSFFATVLADPQASEAAFLSLGGVAFLRSHNRAWRGAARRAPSGLVLVTVHELGMKDHSIQVLLLDYVQLSTRLGIARKTLLEKRRRYGL